MQLDAVDHRGETHGVKLQDRKLSGFSELDRTSSCTTIRPLVLYKGLPNHPGGQDIEPSGEYAPSEWGQSRVHDYGYSGLANLSAMHLALMYDPSVFTRWNDILETVVEHSVLGDTSSSMFNSLTQDLRLAVNYAGKGGVLVSVDTEAGEVMNVGRYLEVNIAAAEKFVIEHGRQNKYDVTEHLEHLRRLVERQDEYLFWGPLGANRCQLDDQPERALAVATSWDKLFFDDKVSGGTVNDILRLVGGRRVPAGDQLLGCLQGWAIFGREFIVPSGYRENYTQQQHLEAAMRLFERYFQKVVGVGWPVNVAEFKLIVGLHDIGKMTSKQMAGDAFRCYEYSYRRYALWQLALAGAIRPEVAEIAATLTCQDDIGNLLRELISGKECIRRIGIQAKTLGIDPLVYFDMAKTLYLCDAGTYTTFGAGIEAMDALFEVRGKRLDFAPRPKNIIDRVKDEIVQV